MPGSGTARYVLQVPGLGFDDYVRMQAAMLRPDPAKPARGWRGTLLGLAGGGVLAIIGFWLAGRSDLRAEFWMESGNWFLSLTGLEVVVLLSCLLAAMLLGWALVTVLRYRRLLRRLHEDGGAMHGAHELLVGDAGLLWRNDSRIVFVPWAEMTGAARLDGMLFLFASRVSAFWMPEAVLAAQPDRAGLLALLARHVRLP